MGVGLPRIQLQTDRPEEAFRALRSNVTGIERSDRLMRREDDDVTEGLHAHFKMRASKWF